MQKRLVVNSAKILSNKTKAATIALFLILTITATLVALPVANAHYPAWTIPSWTFIAVMRNPVGVNQQLLIVFWLQDVPPTATGAYGDRWTFYVDVTKPDGSNETLGPFTSDPVGSAYTTYTPTQVGTYTLVARFPGKTITGLPLGPSSVGQSLTSVNDTYSASQSDPLELIVQQEPIQPWPEAPLPTQFWTRPINDANRNWAPLAANWLSGAAQNVGPTVRFAYGAGPESAHVMWATPMWAGGIMDARYGDTGYEMSHYEGIILTPPIILNGKIYYNTQSLPREGWYCLDLYTGETEYFYNTTGPVTGVSDSSSGSISQQSLAFGQILNYEAPNQHGGIPYLWSTSGPGGTWMMYDAYTGNYICSIANVSAGGTAVNGKDGSILRYSLATTGGVQYLRCWNTTRAIWWKPTFTSNSYWMWRPGLNVTYDGNHGYSLNVSISPAVQGSILAVREDQYVIGGTTGQNDENGTIQGNFWALNLKPAADGTITPTLLWNITFTPPRRAAIPGAGVNTYRAMQLEWVDPEDGVFVFRQQLTRQYWGFSLETGQQLWESEPESQMQFYGLSTADCCNVYQGKFFSYGYGGQVYAYNITTGKVLWIYNATNVGFESPYGNYPVGIACACDGKLYLTSSEHSPTQPLWRGSYLRCINATDGTEIWKVLHWSDGTPGVSGAGVFIADGFLVSLNDYDMQIYCYGKGPSATTVTASPKVSVHGNSVMIEGTVTDQSPGAKDTPAIADESMEAWMEYLYAKQAIPTNATGVPVTLDAVDPNGNYVHIDTVTSDMNGLFKKTFTPEVSGEYTIMAKFAGSKSYWGSSAETAISVSEAPPATAPPEYPQPIDPTLTIVAVGIAVIIAMIIAVVLVGIWIRRK
jgi:outer membrane protein assembly factor BamB